MTSNVEHPAPKTKACPSCQTLNDHDARVCEFCGLFFDLTDEEAEASVVPLEKMAEHIDEGEPRRGIGYLVFPLVGLLAIVATLVLIISLRGPQATWDADMRALGENHTALDMRFEEYVKRNFETVHLPLTVYAVDGVCLINFNTDESPGAVLDRLGGKPVARQLACTFARTRKGAGESPQAKVAIYFNRKRHLADECVVK